MAVDSPVKWFHSGQPNSPQTATAAGGLVPILDACLVDGFGLSGVQSITVDSGTATVITSTQHSFTFAGQIALIEGVTDKVGLNGEQRVSKIISGNNFQFATTEADGPAAGGSAITQKVAPLGWTTLHTGTNKRAYTSTAPGYSGGIVRVDDSALINASAARINAFMGMTSVDMGSGGYPDLGTSNFGWVHAAGSWAVVGDDAGFYWINLPTIGRGSACAWFGDILSDRPADAYASLLTGVTQMYSSGSSPNLMAGDLMIAEPNATLQIGYMARAVHQIGTSVPAYKHVPGLMVNAQVVIGNVGVSFPDPANNGLRLSRTLIVNQNPFSIRGTLPGMHPPLNAVQKGLQNIVDLIPGQGDLSGRMLMPIQGGSHSLYEQPGVNLFDVTGPWR
jgi:hypothetical protein